MSTLTTFGPRTQRKRPPLSSLLGRVRALVVVPMLRTRIASSGRPNILTASVTPTIAGLFAQTPPSTSLTSSSGSRKAGKYVGAALVAMPTAHIGTRWSRFSRLWCGVFAGLAVSVYLDEAGTIPGVTVTAGAGSVVEALQRPARAAPEVLQAPEPLPAEPGFYGWWSYQGALAGVPHVPHPLDGELSLLYVRISPARETSRQTIRSRVLGNHLNGNVGSSTFRFVLAALLVDALDLQPDLSGTKVALGAYDNRRLSTWQREHLLLTSCARERPWEIERDVIAQVAPPLNSAGNVAHAFFPTVRAARAEFRRRARVASSPSATPRPTG
jgi:hypothetical protein